MSEGERPFAAGVVPKVALVADADQVPVVVIVKAAPTDDMVKFQPSASATSTPPAHRTSTALGGVHLQVLSRSILLATHASLRVSGAYARRQEMQSIQNGESSLGDQRTQPLLSSRLFSLSVRRGYRAPSSERWPNDRQHPHSMQRTS